MNTYPSWHSNDRASTTSVAWGDVDSDGDLDLAVGSSPVRIYLNEGPGLQTTAAWSSEEQGAATSVAWGDVDGDGDLDLAVANEDAANRVYLNEAGTLQSKANWSSSEDAAAQSLAWGDVDGDGDLDLAVGYQSAVDSENPCCAVQVFFNEGGVLQTTAAWSSDEPEAVQSVAWGDMDGDGDLDLAVGTSEENTPNRVYLNEVGLLQAAAEWSSQEQDRTTSVAWSDVDGDGDLDLAVGNEDAPNRIYVNTGRRLQTRAAWASEEQDSTQSLAWGDVDGDGDLDLAVANGGFDPDRVYLNEDGMLLTTASWSSNEENDSQSVAWGDVDGDGDLDLAVGSQGAQNWVYRNQSGMLPASASWSAPNQDDTFMIAWGDVNSDGNLDLAVGNVEAPNRVYMTTGSEWRIASEWSSIEKDDTQSVAWGDVDSDGDLDLGFGNLGALSRIHLNDGGRLQTAIDWSPQKMYTTFSMAWGDVDGDGDLDLAVGNGGQIPNRMFLNERGMLQERAVWSAEEARSTWSVAWGDVDNDGDLDLAVGNRGAPNEVYLNNGGILQPRASWTSVDSHQTTSVAWGDVDGDGDLDLAVGNQGAPSQLYQNADGILSPAAVWSSNEVDDTRSVAWGDVDGDGDLDLAIGNWNSPNRIYANEGGMLLPLAVWSATEVDNTQSVALGDADGDGDLDLAVGNWRGPNRIYLNRQPAYPFYPQGSYAVRINLQTQSIPEQDNSQAAYRVLAPANGYSIAHIRSGVIPITYQLFHPDGEPVRAVRGYYSLNGGGSWYPAITTSDTITQNLVPSTDSAWSEHVFKWNVAASHFSGQSDNVTFRLEALPNLKPIANRAPGPFQQPFVATQTFPFRVRGTQVQVVDADNQPVTGGLVYYLPDTQTRDAEPIADHAGQAYRTNEQGYLQGRSLALGPGDRLVALQAITSTQAYTLYYTSAAPQLDGLQMFAVADALVQQLVISSSNPLLLFNLDISLEWDARKDVKYLNDLQLDLQRTSELLYDWTNGQAALGNISIYHNKEQWQAANIRIYATNRLYPHAAIGGVLTQSRAEVASPPSPSDQANVYTPGQVAMPAIWNRYDRAGRNLSEDWARTLARELGHYLFFLQDNYIGFDDQGVIKLVGSCPGVMTDPYTEIYSEYHSAADWLPACAETFSQRQSGRDDWATITHFYPWLQQPTGPIDAVSEAGPKLLPLAVTQIHFVELQNNVKTLDVPAFTLVRTDGTPFLASHRARAFLFQADASGYTQLLDLGAPIYDQIQAWNAKPNDTLCVYDLTAKPMPMAGCRTISASESVLSVYQQLDWQPQVSVVPETEQSLTIKVANVRDDLSLQAQLYPIDQTSAITESIGISLAFESSADAYIGHIKLDQPTAEAYVHIFDTKDRQRSIVTDYSIRAGSTAPTGNGTLLGQSTDRHVLLYSAGTEAARRSFYLLQPTPTLPTLPDWATVVGDAYYVTTAGDTLTPDPMAIRMNYLGYAIDDDKEFLLHIHFWDGTRWRELPTSVDPTQNVALATAPGDGIYALMYGIQVPLAGDGVNLTVYPISVTTTISGSSGTLNGYPLGIFGNDALGTQQGDDIEACTVVSMLLCNR